jgi:hypothetical protein
MGPQRTGSAFLGMGTLQLIKRQCSIGRDFLAILYSSQSVQGMPPWSLPLLGGGLGD